MMTVHVLHAGDGYTYLTRQVAAGDHSVRRGEDLTDYYTAEGNPVGEWLGSGLVNLGVSGNVSEAQMQALFGDGLHPDAEAAIRAAVAGGASPEDAVQASRLGRRFPRIQPKLDGWDDAVADAYQALEVENGRSPGAGVERDLIRWNIAADRVSVTLKRPGTDAEVATHLSQMGKAARQPVAGYDLVFTPVKSVSVLWALGDEATSQQVREAHNAAWQATVAWLETEAGVTRVGAGGVAQVDTHGFVATAFEHRDSRTGDPNLHTHVAVSTKVQGLDGKWRSLDGRVLHALGVAASERYNTLVEHEVRNRLGVSFVDETRGRSKRSVREIAGVSRELRDSFSSRSAAIEDAYETLVQEYVAKHGDTPPKTVQLSLAQRATLETREGKSAPKSLSRQRAEWRLAAIKIIGQVAVDTIGTTVRQRQQRSVQDEILAALSVDELAERVLNTVEDSRATWRRSHVAAEAQRIARAFANVHPGVDAQQVADQVAQAVMARVIGVTAPALNPVPEQLQRQGGESIYRVHGTERFTSTRILGIEDSLIDAARTVAGFTVDPATFTTTIEALNAASEYPLDASQVELARRFASGGRLLEVGIGPAGTGKTTAMRAFARAVEAGGGRVLALAPTAAASTVLAEEIKVEAETAHKLVDVHRHGSPEQQESDQYRIDSNTVLLIDEAGMASTPLLADVLALAKQHGATIRLLGDPAQLAAVESGGALRLIEQRVGASYLDQVHRFIDSDEAAASLLLRDGASAALDFYVTADRTRGGIRQSMLEEIYVAWAADRAANWNSIMVAGTNDEVAALNARARLDLVGQGVVGKSGSVLHDGNKAGLNDVIVTRQNDRKLRSNQGKDFVANGDLWTIIDTEGGDLKVKSLRHGGVLTLPAEYVATHVELGYAATINRVQGMTVDTSHILVDPQSTSREQLYVAATRGRESNRMYAVVEETLEVDAHAPDHLRTNIIDALTAVLARESAERSATEEIQRAQDAAASLSTLLPAYEDARTRVYDPNQMDRMEAAVRDVLDTEIADRVVRDEAWTHLASRLAAHEARGADVRTQLAAVVRAEDVGPSSTVESFAKIYHRRIGAPAGSPPGSGLPSWVSPPPRGTDGDNREVRDWLQIQADLIKDRTKALVDATAANPEPWNKTLRPAPDDASLQRAWRHDLGNVVAFRDLNQVADTESPLGAVRSDDDAYTAAAASLERLRIIEDKAPTEARGRMAALRQRLAGNTGEAAAVGAAERVLRIRECAVEQRRDETDQPQQRSTNRPKI
ncbi:TraA-like conjugal transfer protein [Cryobacterium sp. TMT1-2-2]|uniref:MobF family relaxase n=1 Tax=Cryobacterium sp. TMT1-2-2 TaxID=1259233 RepID=UPI00106CBD30|nr:MobF family relaxase [Cryobacterium sp. TMT1-2-2]TFD14463.1 TraA-like conjugal transfer protein [Cryobacterium sp. TMT1-2-2]